MTMGCPCFLISKTMDSRHPCISTSYEHDWMTVARGSSKINTSLSSCLSSNELEEKPNGCSKSYRSSALHYCWNWISVIVKRGSKSPSTAYMFLTSLLQYLTSPSRIRVCGRDWYSMLSFLPIFPCSWIANDWATYLPPIHSKWNNF